ncbi:proteasome assembly chaperone 2-like isoform X1 [Amphibalanus amphitrite]|uniref:proteasome assembly chaperone 2-like isoform X1 n=2 Tax=Amphibalanus amphitrite TaxID=1232801 RepID=UPI001C8FFF65|nr:proteasome assembly chaperone 2-like isoform X1 [Amphibalanus amphitrite]
MCQDKKMKSLTYVEDVSKDLSGYTLISPSVSVGNVGQLAVDLLLHNLRCQRLGAFGHPSLQQVVGTLPDSNTDGQTHLMTAMEAYVCEKKKLLVIQIRAPISPKGRLSLLAELVQWAAERRLKRVLQLASCHAAARPDPAAPRLCHVTVAGDDVDALTALAPLQPEIPRPEGDAHRPPPYLPGAGFVPDLYRACEAAKFPYTCLLRHTYEGNNIPEAVDICNCLDSWLGLLDESQKSRPDPYSVLGRWRTPPTWSHLFGPAPDASLY